MDQKTIMDKPELQLYSCTQSNIESMGIPCYHILKARTTANEIIYLHDFHFHWFFDEPNEDLIQTAPHPILNPLVIQPRGQPAAGTRRQPVTSTRRNPSRFELEDAATTSRNNNSTSANSAAKEEPHGRSKKALNTKAVTLATSTTIQDTAPTISRAEIQRLLEPSRRSIRLALERDQPSVPASRRHCGDPIPSDEDHHDSEEDVLMARELERLRESNGQAPPLWTTVSEFAGLTRATRVYSLRGRNVEVEGSRRT
jgi:hypothetical protein